MTKLETLALVLAGVTLAGLAFFFPPIWVVVALIAGAAFAAYYFADATPLFAPATTPGRVTIKAFIQNLLRDVRDLLKLDVAARWLTRNVVALAVLANGVFFYADPTLRAAVLAADFHGLPLGAIGLMVVAWLAQTRTAASR